MRLLPPFVWFAAAVALAHGSPAQAQTAAAGAPPSIIWVVAGAGTSVARAGCTLCDRAGVFTNSPGILVDAGLRVTPQTDFGVELLWVRSKLETDGESIKTAFVLGVGQFRPWADRGFLLRAGMGIAIVGNGLYSPLGPALAPPFTTNTLGLMYGAGWVFRREQRWALQVQGSHHVAALGELTTTTGTTVKNVVGNYWFAGAAVVFR